jgi:RNA 3'-terminal phosphate cyclase (ATP)
LERAGYYPAGGGRVGAEITPTGELKPLSLHERGALLEISACARLAQLPDHIALRELDVLARELGIVREHLYRHRDTTSTSPGNVVSVTVKSEHITENFTGFGMRGVPAERVSGRVTARVRRYLSSGVPVGEHLADQLLLPMVLAGGHAFTTLSPTRHTMTNAALLEQFTQYRFSFELLKPDVCAVRLRPPG